MDENQLRELSKKERKEQRRQEKKNNIDAVLRAEKWKTALWWVLGLIVVGGSIAALIWLSVQSDKNRPGVAVEEQGREHIATGTPHPDYNSNPPTSGWHYAGEALWGVYQKELPDEQVLHNLEHGGIWISYVGIDKATIDQIETLAKKYPDKMIVTPRATDDAKIVVASWARLLKLDRFDEAQLVGFITSNKNRSPEPNAQ